MVSHTTRSTEHILGCVMAWGQVCPSRIQSSIVCLQCSIAGLVYYDIADCCPSSPKILVRDVSGLGTQFFICFDKYCLYLTLCTVLTSGGRLALAEECLTVTESSVCICAHMHGHAQEILFYRSKQAFNFLIFFFFLH